MKNDKNYLDAKVWSGNLIFKILMRSFFVYIKTLRQNVLVKLLINFA